MPDRALRLHFTSCFVGIALSSPNAPNARQGIKTHTSLGDRALSRIGPNAPNARQGIKTEGRHHHGEVAILGPNAPNARQGIKTPVGVQ